MKRKLTKMYLHELVAANQIKREISEDHISNDD
jgi:hypothetical protein